SDREPPTPPGGRRARARAREPGLWYAPGRSEADPMETSEKHNGAGRTAAGLDPIVRDGAIHRVSPIDLRPLPPVPVATEEQVREAVERARGAARIWRSKPFEERVAALKRAAKKMLEDRNEVLSLVKLEVGKVDVDAMFTEALGPLDAVTGWARVAGKAMRKKVRLNPLSFPKKRAHIDLVPRGVIGIIAPWNYPASGLSRSLIPAPMTGNGVVLEPPA